MVGGGASGGITISTQAPPAIALVSDAGNSNQAASSNHTHAHGDQAGGSLHSTVSIASAGFAPALSGLAGYVLTFDGANASWEPVGAVGGTQVTGSDNFFVKQVLQVSGSIVNPIGHLTLSSSVGSTVAVSGNLKVIGDISSANLDSRYVLTSSYAQFTSSLILFTATINNFTQSINTFTQSLNGFTASFSSSVQSIGDARYTRTVNAFSGNVIIAAGTNITVNSASNIITISASAAPVDLTALNTFSATINNFTQSINTFSASVNTFSATMLAASSSFAFDIFNNDRIHRVQFLTASGLNQANANQISPSSSFVIVNGGSNNLGVRMPPATTVGDWYVVGITGSLFGNGLAPSPNSAIILWPSSGDNFIGRPTNSNGPALYSYQKYLIFCQHTGSWNMVLLPGWYEGTANSFTVADDFNVYNTFSTFRGITLFTVGNLLASSTPLNLQSSVNSIALTGAVKISNGLLTSDNDLVFSSSTSLNYVSGNLNTTGYAQYKNRVSYHTASFTLTGSDSNRVFCNSGSNPITGTLPLLANVEDGTFYQARILTSSYLIFKASGSDVIQAIGNRTTAGGFIRSNYTGSYITIEKEKDRWFVTSIDGNWEIN